MGTLTGLPRSISCAATSEGYCCEHAFARGSSSVASSKSPDVAALSLAGLFFPLQFISFVLQNDLQGKKKKKLKLPVHCYNMILFF